MVLYKHTPVMLGEVLKYLDPRLGQNFIDCTLGGGGYTVAISKKIGSQGKVLAIDLDKIAIENARQRIKNEKLDNIILVNGNFKNLSKIVKENFNGRKPEFAGIVLDLGLSSAQLNDQSRGFSFQSDSLLDMRFSGHGNHGNDTAAYIVNKYRQEELERIFREYGEEKYAKSIAREIIDFREKHQIKTTRQLTEVIKGAVPIAYVKNKKINFATRVFQALRIVVNNELENLKQVLPQAMNLLRGEGRIAVISYHSLEDRIVKRFFKQESRNCLCPPELPICQCGHKAKLKIITKKVIRPSVEEVIANPRARSAKLRVAEKLKQKLKWRKNKKFALLTN